MDQNKIERMDRLEYLQWLNDFRNQANKRRKKPGTEEHDLQSDCVRWFRNTHPKKARLLFAIPNGGYRTKRTAAFLKAEGVVSGVPDLFLAIPTYRAAGLFIEMKNGDKNDPTENQEEMMQQLTLAGYFCEVCRSKKQFESIINDYLEEER